MEERRLAAIMFTDIVGYTALMGSDEDKAFKILRKNREIQQQLINKYKGKWLKEMGDGILAQFDSAADAAQCAIKIQEAARKELEGLIRIGIHLGDVTFENEDVFGDGVNIASRLQSIADPGGIYISESLQKAIRAKIDIQTKYLGALNLKNVSFPLRTYAIQGEGLPVTLTTKLSNLTGKSLKEKIFGSVLTYIILVSLLLAGGWWIRTGSGLEPSKISSLLVLPFDNFTGSDSLDYFVAGMHASLIGDIGKIGALSVRSKTTARSYRGTEKSISEIASELNVDAIVEASVLCLGDSICLQVQLVSTDPGEEQLWFMNYKEDKSQILNLYNRVTKEISEQISIILTPQERSLLAEARTVDNKAYDAYLKGQFYLDQIDDESLKMAIKYFKTAIEIDPDWAAPYIGLSEVGSYQNQMGFVKSSDAVSMIKENLETALELDPNASSVHYESAVIAVWTEWDWEKGEREFLKALELNPSNALCHVFYAHLLMILRRYDEALFHAEKAVELDPLRPFVLGLYSVVLKNAGEYQSALAQTEKALSIDPNHRFALNVLIDIYFSMGDYERWFEEWKKFDHWWIETWDDSTMTIIEKVFHEEGYLATVGAITKVNEDILSSGGRIPFLQQAYWYVTIGKYDKALDCYEKAYEMHNPNLPYITTWLDEDLIKDYPRYIELLKNMNLPLP